MAVRSSGQWSQADCSAFHAGDGLTDGLQSVRWRILKLHVPFDVIFIER